MRVVLNRHKDVRIFGGNLGWIDCNCSSSETLFTLQSSQIFYCKRVKKFNDDRFRLFAKRPNMTKVFLLSWILYILEKCQNKFPEAQCSHFEMCDVFFYVYCIRLKRKWKNNIRLRASGHDIPRYICDLVTRCTLTLMLLTHQNVTFEKWIGTTPEHKCQNLLWIVFIHFSEWNLLSVRSVDLG